MVGQCRLCLQQRVLRNSHVVPEFLYTPIYDGKHRMFAREGGRLVARPPLQKGLREKLLCSGCEGDLSAFEKYNRETLFGGRSILCARSRAGVEFHGLDYARVRLFFLSLLWRMSIAKGRFWAEVALGPREDALRRMVYDGDPGNPETFSFCCTIPFFNGVWLDDLIVQPDAVRYGQDHYYRCVLRGLVVVYYASTRLPPPESRSLFVSREGDWLIPVKDVGEIDFLAREATLIADAGPRGRTR